MRALTLFAALLLAGSTTACAARIEVDGARAHARVVKQVAMGPRIPGSPGHQAFRTWLRAELEPLGARWEEQTFVDSALTPPTELHNLIARFGPESGRRVALLAHYDTRPWADQDPDTTRRREPVPGANDGGSGVAVLLEVAESIHRTAPPIGVDLVFLDGEDQGTPEHVDLYSRGARGYAARLPGRGDGARPVAGFVFDMVGDKDLGIFVERNSAARASNLVQLVVEGARATGGSGFHAEPRFTVIDDHLPLLDAGMPTVDVIDFDYPAWHTTADLPNRLSPESLAQVARVAVWLVTRSPLAR